MLLFGLQPIHMKKRKNEYTIFMMITSAAFGWIISIENESILFEMLNRRQNESAFPI